MALVNSDSSALILGGRYQLVFLPLAQASD
jgi:hypothetical protein